MNVQTPTQPPRDDPEIDAGVIEDARARQRRHQVSAAIAVAAALGIGLLILGGAGGGHHGGSSRSHGRPRSGQSPTATSRKQAALSLPACGSQPATRGTVEAWRMGAVQFLSPKDGVGVTASQIECSSSKTQGSQVSSVSQPVLIARTANGGLTWRLTGQRAPTPANTPWADEAILAISDSQAWVQLGNGKLLMTQNAGATWRRESLAGRVISVQRNGNRIWALTCLQSSTATATECRPTLWSAKLGSSKWIRALRAKMAVPDPQLAISSDGDILVGFTTVGRTSHGELLSSTEHGAHWRAREAPSWDHRRCNAGAGAMLAAAGPHSFWMLCLGNGAAGSSTKGLLRSTNAGATWTLLSAVRSLTRRQAPAGLPTSEPSSLQAGSSSRLWLSLTNGLSESTDAGRTWRTVRSAFDKGGQPSAISVLGPTHAWLLAASTGIWRTTNGRSWRKVGRLHDW